MRSNILRTLTLIGAAAAVLLFALMMWDEFANNGDLAGVIILAFVIDILFLITLLFIPVDNNAPTTRLDYPGDVHEVVDLEGIGPKYAKALHAAGIKNTQQLLFTPLETVVDVTGARAKTVGRWFAMAQLIKVNGIGPQYAEVLARVDVTGIEDLATRTPAALVKTVNTYLDGLKSTVIGSRAGVKRMGTWIKEAKAMEKVHIDLANLSVHALESKAAKAGATA